MLVGLLKKEKFFKSVFFSSNVKSFKNEGEENRTALNAVIAIFRKNNPRKGLIIIAIDYLIVKPNIIENI